MKPFVSALVLLLTFCGGVSAAFLHGGGGIAVCVWTGSVAGSCLPAADTTDLLTAPVGFANLTTTLGFNSGTPAVAVGGQQNTGCPGVYNDIGVGTGCLVTTELHVCQTPGNAATNAHPWWNDDVGSWQVSGSLQYNPNNTANYFFNSIPSFSPFFTYDATTGSRNAPALNINYTSLMQSLCGADMSSYFVDGFWGPMPNLAVATASMTSNDTLTVSPAPAGMPFWPSSENNIGPGTGTVNPPYNQTLVLTGASFGYPAPYDKGTFVVHDNGTTINGGTVFWVNPSNNQSCIAWDAGLDLTVENFTCDFAEMGLDRGNIRTGIFTLINDVFANSGCQSGSCGPGKDHNLYITGSLPNGGFDTLLATNLYNPDPQNEGWNFKLRPANSVITQSFFGSRVNNGSSSAHAPMDFPCGGTNTVTYSAIEANAWGHTANQPHGGANLTGALIVTAEESGTNTTTAHAGVNPQESGTCPTPLGLLSSGPITATITGPNTFTTTTNPALFHKYALFVGGTNEVWDLGVSGLMVNGPAPITGWSGPVGGVYTVQLAGGGNTCFNGEGTLAFAGFSIYSCFAANSGTVTLYSVGEPLTVLTNTSSTASVQTPVDPTLIGLAVGDTLYDNNSATNNNTITSITGSGPWTINLSCPTTFTPPNCLASQSFGVISSAIASGTYNSGTGAVSLTIGDLGLSPSSSFTIQGIQGTGAVSSLNGTWTATVGTSGTTLNFTGPTGLTLTIGSTYPSFSSGVVAPGGTTLDSLSLDSLTKSGPIQVTASTTGTGCDGVNVLCGIGQNPTGFYLFHGWQILGTDIAQYGCMAAGQIGSIQPKNGSTGTGYAVNDTITLAGGTFETAAIVKVTSVSGGAITGVSINSGGVYTSFVTTSADKKTFMQGSTSGSGTGAEFQFPYPEPIFGGTGPNFTIRLAQASGTACITGSTTNQVYQFLRPVNDTFDHDLVIWDGQCPFGGQCNVMAFNGPTPTAFQLASISNSLLFADAANGGPSWGSGGVNNINLNMTDAGGNVLCASRNDLGTSARCAIPPFTAASFTGSITGGAMTVGCGSGCPTIASGAYNSTTGIVTITPTSASIISGSSFNLSGLTGTGSVSSLNGLWYFTPDVSTPAATMTFHGPTGLGSITITGGTINAAVATACKPGMYVWDNQVVYGGVNGFVQGQPGNTIAGTRIASGSAPNFTLQFPSGGPGTTDVASGPLNCGWGTPSSAFNGTIASGTGILTVNSNLVGSIHVNDYLADISASLPDNVQITSQIDATHFNTNAGSAVSAEYMVSVR